MWTQQQLLQPVPPLKLFHSFPPSNSNHAKIQSLSKLNSTHNLKTALTLEELPPNALRRKKDANWRGGFSLGVDLGMARTGIALSKGFTFRPLTVTFSAFSFDFPMFCCFAVLFVFFIFVNTVVKCWERGIALAGYRRRV